MNTAEDVFEKEKQIHWYELNRTRVISSFATAALLGCGAYYYVHESGPKLIEYDADGNEMRLLRGPELIQLFGYDDPVDNLISMRDAEEWERSFFPREFWTQTTANGETEGCGTQEGSYDNIVLKSSFGGYLSADAAGTLIANKDRACGSEKFKPVYVSGD